MKKNNLTVRKYGWAVMMLFSLSIGFATPLFAMPTSVRIQDEEADKDDDSGNMEDSDENGIPDDMENWDSPYESPKDLSDAIVTAEKSGTCWEFMNARYSLILDETRYWSAVAAPDSEGERFIAKVLGYLLSFQLEIAKSRLTLENLPGDLDKCEGNKDLGDIADPLEQIKLKMRRAGWLIDTGDMRELNDTMVTRQCSNAQEEVEELGAQISGLEAEFNERVASDDLESVSNTKELLMMVQKNYGNASAAMTQGAAMTDLEEKARFCSGARDEVALGMDVLTHAEKFNSGTKEDDSSVIEEVDAKIKMFLGFIARERVEILSRDAQTRDLVLAALASAESKIVETQIAFAVVKYTNDPQTEQFDQLLEEIKSELKPVIDAVEGSDAQEVTTADRRKSAAKLFVQARKQTKSLNSALRDAEQTADTDEEEDIVQYVEQSLATDAATARKAAMAYRAAKSYEEAQLQAFSAIYSAKSGRQTLTAVQE